MFFVSSAFVPGKQGKRELGEGMMRKQKGKKGEERGFEKPGSVWHLIAAQQIVRKVDWHTDDQISSCVAVVNFAQHLRTGPDPRAAGRGADDNNFHLVCSHCMLQASMVFVTYYSVKIHKTVRAHSQMRCMRICPSDG